jgi:hypothetical protein
MSKLTVTQTPGAIKKFSRSSWRFQQTFLTPLKNLNPFVATILDSVEQIESAVVTIDGYVFEPKNLHQFLASQNVPPTVYHDVVLTALGREAIEMLLRTTFSDWIDFVFQPLPKPFVIYADHDEYTTFFANTKGNLNQVVLPLEAAGFETVEYKRVLK